MSLKYHCTLCLPKNKHLQTGFVAFDKNLMSEMAPWDMSSNPCCIKFLAKDHSPYMKTKEHPPPPE